MKKKYKYKIHIKIQKNWVAGTQVQCHVAWHIKWSRYMYMDTNRYMYWIRIRTYKCILYTYVWMQPGKKILRMIATKQIKYQMRFAFNNIFSLFFLGQDHIWYKCVLYTYPLSIHQPQIHKDPTIVQVSSQSKTCSCVTHKSVKMLCCNTK